MRAILLVLVLFAIVIIISIASNSAPVGSNVFETRTENTKVQEQLTGLQNTVQALQHMLEGVLNKPKDPFGVNDTAFHDMIRDRASVNGTIVLASVDSGYVDMAINLYFTSFHKFGIDNYLFVGSDSEVCGALSVFNIACFDYIHDKDARSSSSYYSKAFKRKTHLKTKIILEALKLELKVLITDVDIVFMKNPFLHIGQNDNFDIEISSDVVEGNSGFYLSRPTPAAIKLHETAWKQGLEHPEISNQKAIDRNLEKMVRWKQLRVRNLDPKLFLNGRVFFEDGVRMFKGDNPCATCIMVHNNWIVSGAAKIYRFKEYGMWESNRNEYYSNEHNKYLSFGLPGDYGASESPRTELKALQYALILAAILDRIVILPRFHCYGCKYHGICKKSNVVCSFGTFYRIDAFDKAFDGRYRENVFLEHDRVPNAVKESNSPLYFLDTPLNRKKFPTIPDNVVAKTPADRQGVSMEEIQQWFGNATESVLNFHSLYHGINYDENDPKVKDVLVRIKSAFVYTDYRQYGP